MAGAVRVAALALALLAGCAHERRALAPAVIRDRNVRTLLLRTEVPAGFDSGRPQSVLSFFAAPVVMAIGAAAEGPSMAREQVIVDPAFDVGEALTRAAAGRYLLEVVTTRRGSPDEATARVVPGPSAADLVLDVGTTWWGIRFAQSQRLGRYAVHLEMEATLTDARDGTVLAHNTCIGDDPRTWKGRRYDDFEANGGALIKEQLAWAAARCVRLLQIKVFSIQPAEPPAPQP